MSDVITEVGQFTQKNGRAARVVHIEEGIAFGFDSADAPCGWDVKTGVESTVPKPFRISTNGPGVYERADGKEFEVDVTPERQFQTGLSSDFIWWNEKDAEAWRDDGTWHLKGSRELPALNLVRYLRPLPKPAVDPEVWLPTTDIRLSAEQRFERNGVSKWMPVTFQEGT